MPDSFPFSKPALERYLASIYKTDVKVTAVRRLASNKSRKEIKEFGYGNPLLVEAQIAGQLDRLVLHTVRPDKFGHERRSDRAGNILLDYDTFNKLPQHVPCLGIGALTETGDMLSLEDAGEFFLITHYTPGQLFAQDLKKLLEGDALLPEDKERALALSDYLVEIHAEKHTNTALYHRCVRDLLGHGEGIMGLIDSYPADFTIAPPTRLQAIEHRLIDWRWFIRGRSYRLSQVHGDYHPWNVLFQPDNTFYLLDRSRGEWGEPADDVSAMSVNFIFFSLQRYGSLHGSFRVLFELFWDQYLQGTHDVEISSVIQPFYAWRALVLAHPVWYPNLNYETRQMLFTFIENVLADEWFDPKRVNAYLGVSP
jgi:hypothetical protein